MSINKKPVFLIEKKYSDLKNQIETQVKNTLFPEFESEVKGTGEFGEQGFKTHQNLPLPLFSEARKVVPLGQGRFLVVRNNQQAIMLNKRK